MRTPPSATGGSRSLSWRRRRSCASCASGRRSSRSSSRRRPCRCRWNGASSSAGSSCGRGTSASACAGSSRRGACDGRALEGGCTGTRGGPCIICSGSSRDRHRHPQRRGRPHAHRAELSARPSPPRELYEWGPAVRPEELETLFDKLHYLSRVATFVVFSGSLPRDVEDDFYAEAIRDLNRRGVQCVLDCEGEPLRLGVEAEPFLVAPNQREAESLVGQEFSDEEDFSMALDAIADLGARNVLITEQTSCFGLLREDRQVRRLRASIAPLEPVASVGAGDVLLGAFLAARYNQRPLDDALRSAVGAAGASVLELGPGRFDPREANRLAAGVELEELQPVGA